MQCRKAKVLSIGKVQLNVTLAFSGSVPLQNGCTQWSLAFACLWCKSHYGPIALPVLNGIVSTISFRQQEK